MWGDTNMIKNLQSLGSFTLAKSYSVDILKSASNSLNIFALGLTTNRTQHDDIQLNNK